MTTPYCPLCSRPMIRTSERYFTCEQGHGKLMPVAGLFLQFGGCTADSIDVAKADAEDAAVLKKLDQALKGGK